MPATKAEIRRFLSRGRIVFAKVGDTETREVYRVPKNWYRPRTDLLGSLRQDLTALHVATLETGNSFVWNTEKSRWDACSHKNLSEVLKELTDG